MRYIELGHCQFLGIISRWDGDVVCSREMEVRSDGIPVRCDKIPAPVIPRTRLQVWFIRVCSSILLWTCFVQLVAVWELWHPHLFSNFTNRISQITLVPLHVQEAIQSPPPLLPPSGFFLISSLFFGLTLMEK